MRGSDLRPWYQAWQGEWLIIVPAGSTSAQFGPNLEEETAWQHFKGRLSGVAAHLEKFAEKAKNRSDKGDFWWELRPCDYYDEFNKPKIFWADIGKFPRFSYDEEGYFCNDKGFILIPPHVYILGVLQSRVSWFCISKLCVPLGERAGLIRYQQKSQFISRLPIPDASPPDRADIGALAMAITEQARARYALHERVRRRLRDDLAAPGATLNQKLTSWWALDFPTFRAEVKKALKRDIPLRERDDWQGWLDEQRGRHDAHSAEIVRLERDLNARVYALFALTPDEIAIIEASTKYPYGEV